MSGNLGFADIFGKSRGFYKKKSVQNKTKMIN